MGFNYATSSGINGPFIAFGGLGGSIDYSCQLTADYGSGTTMRFRTRNDDAKRWNPWHTLIHEGHLTGQVAFFAMTTPPDGWLPANGAAVSRSTFASLFAAIGTTYGTGDGTTTFNLPDLRGEFVRGWDANVDQGRIFGSKQKGSLVIHNDDQDTYAGGIINNMTNKAVRDVAGYDFVPEVKDYTSGLVINNVTLLNQQSISQVFGSNPQNWMYMTRPRNIALLPCIKY
ncbi:phage tail protein [Chromobacterium violaceum]|nr:phage tail protein [Chromobacterium violaceum]